MILIYLLVDKDQEKINLEYKNVYKLKDEMKVQGYFNIFIIKKLFLFLKLSQGQKKMIPNLNGMIIGGINNIHKLFLNYLILKIIKQKNKFKIKIISKKLNQVKMNQNLI